MFCIKLLRKINEVSSLTITMRAAVYFMARDDKSPWVLWNKPRRLQYLITKIIVPWSNGNDLGKKYAYLTLNCKSDLVGCSWHTEERPTWNDKQLVRRGTTFTERQAAGTQRDDLDGDKPLPAADFSETFRRSGTGGRRPTVDGRSLTARSIL